MGIKISAVKANQSFQLIGEAGVWRIYLWLDEKVLIEKIGTNEDRFVEYDHEVLL